MNILFLSRWFPYPVNNGSKLRVAGLLQGLSKDHDVTLLSFADQPSANPDATELRTICSEVYVVPWREFNPQSRRAWFGLFSLRPRFLVDTHSNEMADLIRSLIAAKKYDLIIASQLSMASYYPCFMGVPALFEEIELGVFYDQANHAGSLARRLRLSLTWFKLHRYLSRLFGSFRAGTVASEQERHLFVEHFPKFGAKIEVLPNCINTEDYKDLNVKSKSNHLIFSGSFTYNANYEAMQWFVHEVYPRVLERIPDAHLLITGDHANRPLPSMKNITLTGYVDDIKSLIASCSVSIAPLRSGGGTRLKILEAMSIGVPVVSTLKGAEGLGAQNGIHLLVSDDPSTFAESVIRICMDQDFRNQLSINAARFVKENYDWSVVSPQLMKLVDRVSTE